MSKLKKRLLIVLLVVVVISAVLGIISKTGNNPVANAVNTIFSPVYTVLQKVTQPVDNFFEYLSDMKDLKAENERLKSELSTLKKESRNQEEYKKENDRLKKLLDLTDELSNYETVAAKVVAYEPGNWFYELTLNKGTKQGISASDVVVTEAGLVGKVVEAGPNWAKVSTILDSSNAVGIKLNRTGDIGVVQGDLTLLKSRRLRIEYISKDTSLISGDLLKTSGLGGLYPSGISVGTVEEVQIDNIGELSKAIVKPSVDLDNIYEVAVITNWEMKEYDTEAIKEEYENSIREQERDNIVNDTNEGDEN